MGDGVIEILLNREIRSEADPKVREGLQRALEIVQTSGYYNLADLEAEEADFEFWNTDINSAEDARSAIEQACEAGTTYDDVDDYVNTLHEMGKINADEASYLLNWATMNYDI